MTVRNIDPKDNAWLKCQPLLGGISVEEFVRPLIREKCVNSNKHHAKPSEAFQRYFGPEHGVEQPHPEPYGYRPISFADENSA